MREFYEITDGVVTNVIVADQTFADEHGYLPYPDIKEFGIGWTFENGEWSKPYYEYERYPPLSLDEIDDLLENLKNEYKI